MEISIEEINFNNAKHVNTLNGEFIIDAKLVLNVADKEIRYKIVEIPQTTKRYSYDEIDYLAYIKNPNKTIYFAYVDKQIAGQIILRKNWNQYAYVVDIVVDAKFRRRGVGERLMLQAKQWARVRNLAGIMLETQNNNVSACKFYEWCGFQLGGFDKYLYKGINKETKEFALYWYLMFEDTAPPTDNGSGVRSEVT